MAAKAGNPKTKRRRRETASEREILATAHALGAALHRAGAVDADAMRAIDALCRPGGKGAGARRPA